MVAGTHRCGRRQRPGLLRWWQASWALGWRRGAGRCSAAHSSAAAPPHAANPRRCEIWDFSRDTPEPLTQGHSADVYGLAFHPKKPHKFATACDSANVFLWNARRRQLMASRAAGGVIGVSQQGS